MQQQPKPIPLSHMHAVAAATQPFLKKKKKSSNPTDSFLAAQQPARMHVAGLQFSPTSGKWEG